MITDRNPYPMELKYEKVYCPLLSLAMKRYSGLKYETPDDIPVVESKGIETIRRDYVPAVSTIMEKILDILFKYQDLSLVKKYFQYQYLKIDQGEIEINGLFLNKDSLIGSHDEISKDDAIKTTKNQLLKTIGRVTVVFNVEIQTWVKEVVNTSSVKAFLSSLTTQRIMNRTKSFRSKYYFIEL